MKTNAQIEAEKLKEVVIESGIPQGNIHVVTGPVQQTPFEKAIATATEAPVVVPANAIPEPVIPAAQPIEELPVIDLFAEIPIPEAPAPTAQPVIQPEPAATPFVMPQSNQFLSEDM